MAEREWRGHGPAEMIVCPNGPLLVRGDVDLVDASGAPVERSRATVAICRCGASAIKPWCDGSHKLRPREGS